MSRSLIPAEMTGGEYLFKRYGARVADYEKAANADARLHLLDGVLIMPSPAGIRTVKWHADRPPCVRSGGTHKVRCTNCPTAYFAVYPDCPRLDADADGNEVVD